MAERDALRLHVDDPALFREAVAFTAAETRFASRLVEKDYFCSVILRHLATADAGLGANDSRQYAAVVSYETLVASSPETIKIEVGLREPILTEATPGEARTVLLDPVSGKPLVPAFKLPCVVRQEAMAEKLRAALSRREVAIRDFFDVDFAVRVLRVRLGDDELIELVKRKLAIPGNAPVDVSEGRLAALRRQIDAELRPVLRDVDFIAFDLDRAFAAVASLARRVGSKG